MQTRERRLDRFELRDVTLERLQFLLPPVQHAGDDRGDQPLGKRDHIVEIGVGHLRFHHPELGEVAARLALLGAEGRTEGVHLAQRHRVRFVVQLPALRQVRLLIVEILDWKQCGRALAGRRRKDRRVGEDEALVVEEVAHGVDDLVAHAQDRGLPLGADPQVAAIHQVINAVFLWRNGVVTGFVYDLETAGDQLVTAGLPRVFLDHAGDDDGAFLAEVIGPGKGGLVDVAFPHDDLDEARAVANRQEMNLPARSAVVEPALDGDGRADVVADLVDIGMHGGLKVLRS